MTIAVATMMMMMMVLMTMIIGLMMIMTMMILLTIECPLRTPFLLARLLASSNLACHGNFRTSYRRHKDDKDDDRGAEAA